MHKFLNLHQDQKCFIVGAGPSVGFLDLSGIDQHPVICVNSSIVLMSWKDFGETNKRFWMSTDVLCQHWSYFRDYVLKADCVRLVRNSWKKYTNKWPEVKFHYFLPFTEKTSNKGLLSTSSILAALDFAIYLGCKNIYLLGVDHRPLHGYSHFWQFLPRTDVRYPRRDGKPGDFFPCQRQQKRIFDENMQYFEILNNKAQTKNIKIFNCSSISEVKVFPKISLQDALR